MKKILKLKFSFWITFFFGITFAYFVWLTWDKATELIGNSNLIWIITGTIVILGILIGKLTVKKLAERFM